MLRKRAASRLFSRPQTLLGRTVRVEPLERRYLLAVDTTFQAGVLDIIADAQEDVVVTSQDGLVKINGADPAFGPLAAEQVVQLHATGGAWSTIDLSGVWENREAFSSLEVTVQSDPPAWAVLGQEWLQEAAAWAQRNTMRPWTSLPPTLSPEQVDAVVSHPE